MFISDLLQEKNVSVSCELFPPKSGSDMPDALETVKRTADLKPDFISVTCSAKALGNNIELAGHVRKCGATPLAHLSCVSSSRDEIDNMLDTLTLRHISNILALRGDIPEGMQLGGGFSYASELVERIKTRGGFCVGAACYPEGHVESANQAQDLVHLKRLNHKFCGIKDF